MDSVWRIGIGRTENDKGNGTLFHWQPKVMEEFYFPLFTHSESAETDSLSQSCPVLLQTSALNSSIDITKLYNAITLHNAIARLKGGINKVSKTILLHYSTILMRCSGSLLILAWMVTVTKREQNRKLNEIIGLWERHPSRVLNWSKEKP